MVAVETLPLASVAVITTVTLPLSEQSRVEGLTVRTTSALSVQLSTRLETTSAGVMVKEPDALKALVTVEVLIPTTGAV